MLVLGLLIAGLGLAERAVVGYFMRWGDQSVTEIDYASLTHVIYGFAQLRTTAWPSAILFDNEDKETIRTMSDLARTHGTKRLISIGGWTGSQTFSQIAASPPLRDEFIKNALALMRVTTPSLDGIDLDWEFPTRKGGGNIHSMDDTSNFKDLISHLREALDEEFPGSLLTASVPPEPFPDSSGLALRDVTGFAKHLSFVNIMAYSIMGPWSRTTGPNAPLRASRDLNSSPLSFSRAIDDWLNAGFPANQLTVGLAFFGSSMFTMADMSLHPSIMYAHKGTLALSLDGPETSCGRGTNKTTFSYHCLRSGILSTPALAQNGFTRFWDKDSETPWLFNPTSKRFITYDDPASIKIKVDYARCKGLYGVMVWDSTKDYQNELIAPTLDIHLDSKPDQC